MAKGNSLWPQFCRLLTGLLLMTHFPHGSRRGLPSSAIRLAHSSPKSDTPGFQPAETCLRQPVVGLFQNEVRLDRVKSGRGGGQKPSKPENNFTLFL